jgi:hypothetical protein
MKEKKEESNESIENVKKVKTSSSVNGENDHDGDEGVTVPEEYQKKVHEVVSGAKDMHHIKHLDNRVSARREELYDEERKAKEGKKGKSKVPTEYSMSDSPSM